MGEQALQDGVLCVICLRDAPDAAVQQSRDELSVAHTLNIDEPSWRVGI